MPESANTRARMGLVEYCVGIQQRHKQLLPNQSDCSTALGFLEYAAKVGAGGIQYSLKPADISSLDQFRKKLETSGLFFEASISLPKDDSDSDRFERDVLNARKARASLARTVMLGGRRYETFDSSQEFETWSARAIHSLELAKPILVRHKFPLAVENHKDHRLAEKIAILKKIDCEYIGACVDVGNNISLLDDPIELVRQLAPWAMTVHFKDQALRPYADGFLLADAALGQGSLDLPKMVEILIAANPKIHFNLEVITRDPLKVPVFTEKYWATLKDVPASDLAATWARVKSDNSPASFALVSEMKPEEQIQAEKRNIDLSLKYAHEHLGL
jgi:sugar phosphate isomerase/epimerase